MLKFLAIENVVLIEKAEIDFSQNLLGLCILSGETGSGKSILLDAFGLAIGFRSNLRLIGLYDEKATIAAEFDISKNDNCKNLLAFHSLIDEKNPDELRIRRLIQKNSTNKIYVNDQIIGVNLLAKIGETLVEIHGQHDSRGLLNPAFHEIMLDQFAKNQEILQEIKEIYEKLKNVEEKINQLQEKKNQAIREKDYLQYIINELKNADIQFGEEEELSTKKEVLLAKNKILKFIEEFKNNLLQTNTNLSLSQKTLIKNQNIVENYLPEKIQYFAKLSDEIDAQNVAIEKNINEIQNLERDLLNNKENIDEIEERLFEIKSLSRKFNVNSNELSKIVADAIEKINLIDNESFYAKELENQKTELQKQYQKSAQKLHEKRKESALILSKKVEEELKFLRMENVKFLVQIDKILEKQSETGFDKIRFFASINNNNFDDIAKIASGGELSRFMLALKVALIDVKSCPTLIFDEIDTGIGGKTADAVGKRLKELSKNFQIFVVTHQAQIAAKANLHFLIQKAKIGNKIKTTIEKLEKESQNKEIARMISGENITEESLAMAKILLKN